MVETLVLAHETSSFSKVLCKRDVLKNILKFTDKLKKQSSGGALSKDVLNNFAKFTNNIFAGISFLKLWTGNLRLSEKTTGNVNKVFFKIFQIS